MAEDPSYVAAELVERFRRQRPLRAGSLIVTIFGDSIMPRGGAIALGRLIRLAAPFGLNERLVRTATARLAHEGWVEARHVGKRSEYR
ncbi:MAG: phenylacetic acid degradation operon negative regulatory protein PaaX, partial [Steroidobacteraceae bacterium]